MPDTYSFTLIIEGEDVLSAPIFDQLSERFDDAVFGHRYGYQFGEFEAQGASLGEAVDVTISEVEQIPGLRSAELAS